MRTKHLLATTALVATGLAVTPGRGAHAQEAAPADPPVLAQEEERITVTGSFVRRKSQFTEAQPIETVASEDLLQIGASTVRDLIGTLTANAGSQNNPDAFTQNLTTGTENINLRGLGVQSTLVLLNGKRQVLSAAQTDSGLNFVDTASLVPLIAVDRVEILKDGATSLYGTDAVAGVVNFITKKDFEGFEAEFDFQAVAGEGSAQDYRLAAIYGRNFFEDKLNVVAAVEVLDRTPLTTRERDLRRGAELPPNFLSVATLGNLPGSFIIPVASADFAINQPELFAAHQAAFNQNTALFDFSGALGLPAGSLDPQVLPVLPTAAFGAALPPEVLGTLPPFLVGDFTSFVPNAALGGADPTGISDGLTAATIGTEGFLAGALAGFGVPGFSLDFLTPEQQAQFGATIGAIASQISLFQTAATLAGEFTPFDGTPAVPDPDCATAATLDDDISLLPGQPATLGQTGISPAGQCGLDFGTFFNVIPRELRIQGYTNFTADVNESIELYGEFGIARNRAERETVHFPISAGVSLPADYPFNPFGAGTIFAGRSLGAGQLGPDGIFTDSPNPNFFEYDTWRLSMGARLDLSDSWTADISFVRATNNYFLRSSDGVESTFFAALNGFGGPDCAGAGSGALPGVGPCQFYNVFGAGFLPDNTDTTTFTQADGTVTTIPVANSPELLETLVADITVDGTSRLFVFDAVASGDLFELFGNTVGMAFGFQYRDEFLAQDFDDNTATGNFLFVTAPIDPFEGKRTVYALFTEMNIPLYEDLEFTWAVRYENFGQGLGGDTIDPKLQLIWTPTENLSFRATGSTSFRAPSLFQLFGNATTLNSVSDPITGGAPFLAISTEGSIASGIDLLPETSRTITAGASWEPVTGLELSFDYFNFQFENIITEIEPQELVNLCAGAGSGLPPGPGAFDGPLPTGSDVQRLAADSDGDGLTCDEAGTVISITTPYTNEAFINTDGFDWNARYTREVGPLGTFSLGFQGTYVLSYEIPVGGETIDAAGLRNDQNFADPVPELRFNGSMSWFRGNHSAAAFVRYRGEFEDDENCVGPVAGATAVLATFGFECEQFATIDSFVTVDLQYQYQITENFRFTTGVINVADEEPPFVLTDSGFETRTDDPRGRLVYVRLGASF